MKFTPFLMLSALAVACAKQELPPGTLPDRLPPQVVETRPSYAEAVPGFDGDAWIRFDEPIMDPRSIERTLLSSPAGIYQVNPGRTRIRIRPKEGWRDGIVYYFAIPGGIPDLLRNRTTAPIELLFSTGQEVSPTLVQGRVYDRVMARGTRGARLLFLSQDSVPYTAVSDTGGVFRLPGLPLGEYRALAFLDQNRDFQYDEEFEPGDTVPFELTEALTTASVDLWMIPADSTAPILVSAEIVDDLTMRLTFDDPIDPEALLTDVIVSIRDDSGNRPWGIDELVVGLPIPPVVKQDSTEEAGQVPPQQPSGPSRRPAPIIATVTVAEPFIEGTYRVHVSGIFNLRGLSGGGDTTIVFAPAPVPADSTDGGAESDESAARP